MSQSRLSPKTAAGKGIWIGSYRTPDEAPSQVEFAATVEDSTGNYQDAQAASAVLAITEKGAVSLELTAEKENHIIYGDQVTMTARVRKADAEDRDQLSGSFTFYLGDPAKDGRELGTIEGRTQKDSLGQETLGASLTRDKKILTAGTHKVYVVYGGSPYFGEGSSIGLTVEKRQLLWDTSDLKASRQEGSQGEAAVTGTLRVTGIPDQGPLLPNRGIIETGQGYTALEQGISIPGQGPSVPDPEALAEIIQELEVPSASNEEAISTEPRQKAQRPAVVQPPLEKKTPAVIWWVILAALAAAAGVAWIWLIRKKRKVK